MPTPLVRPTNMQLAFAAAGLKNALPVAPATGNNASYSSGFPALTMQPIAAGGRPPKGKDFNGVLYDITSHTLWVNSGGQYRFDAALAAYIGGYPVGMVLQNNAGTASFVCATANNSIDFNATPASIGVNWLPYSGPGLTNTNVATTGGAVAITSGQASCAFITVSGALTSNAVLTVPNALAKFTVINNTTGAFTVTVKTAGVAGVYVRQGAADLLICDATAIRYAQGDMVTQTTGDNSPAGASTAFVAATLAAGPPVPNQLPGTGLGAGGGVAVNAKYVDDAVIAFGIASVPQYRTANFAAGIAGDYWTDTTGGAFTMTLPDPPGGANPLRVQDFRGSWGQFPLTINPGTKTILGVADVLVCNTPGELIELAYDGTTWRIA